MANKAMDDKLMQQMSPENKMPLRQKQKYFYQLLKGSSSPQRKEHQNYGNGMVTYLI